MSRHFPDPLEAAWVRLWMEIQGLLPRHRWLYERGRSRSRAQEEEFCYLTERLGWLRKRTCRYRAVLLSERLRAQKPERPAPP